MLSNNTKTKPESSRRKQEAEQAIEQLAAA
jgi:hypothetical protein